MQPGNIEIGSFPTEINDRPRALRFPRKSTFKTADILLRCAGMTYHEIAAALPKAAITAIDNLPFPKIASGKVREIFDLGDALLLVASDRLSAFDVILPDGIPGKGAILTQMSNWWFEQTKGLIQNHLLPDQQGEFARRGITSKDIQLRSMIV